MDEEAARPAPGRTLALVAKAREGDARATEELFELLLPRVRQIAALRMGLRESELWEREDLVQETLLDAFRSLPSFEARHDGALCHWLATLVQNNLSSHHRQRKAGKRDVRRVVRSRERSSLLTDSVLGADANTPSRIAAAGELEERIESVLLEMDEPKRRAIEMRRLCELDFDQIAAELGLGGASSARSLYSRALAELADRL
jgi:RNA polymerase sigma factor (sigma-70 family)